MRNQDNPDRRVHGHTAEGHEIARYDTAGRWYIEGPESRKAVSVKEAASKAATIEKDTPGGRTFEKMFRERTR